MSFSLPLMENNITAEDRQAVIDFLQGDPILTQSENVRAFEREWSEWLGVPRSVFVNSGASANFITMAALRHLRGPGEVIVPALTWVSDIASVLAAGHTPVFADVLPRTLAMDPRKVADALTDRTRAVFLTHCQGFDGLDDALLAELERRGIPLIEDVCESHGATHDGRKAGTFGLASNFSFYFAHHMSTIEGGMICTRDEDFYQTCRMLRSHGMVRESDSPGFRRKWEDASPDLNPKFIFAWPAGNCRSTEINAVIGRSQLKRLDANNARRTENFKLFLSRLDPGLYWTDFLIEGSVNYAFPLVMNTPDEVLRDRLMAVLDANGIEHRRGNAGGGNQLRQPYLDGIAPPKADLPRLFPVVDHIHFFGFYIGNYPSLDADRIRRLCDILNSVRP
ncbi:MAG TPA: DegT/DnrJ/EryC1/StrS family aminotransferase [Kiritimatiellia bacterium]|nr:DegT/DnrJ/EryC1/StrS family aminotransferase [Kiritimatiellia bacterium]HRX06168.1 DegT/DnrJ/EryC1/StrS family aminotransferase [Kiritimatiellia bacterium]